MYVNFSAPGNKPIFVLTGEGHREELVLYVDSLLKYFRTASLPMSISNYIKPKDTGVLYFPSKVCCLKQSCHIFYNDNILCNFILCSLFEKIIVSIMCSSLYIQFEFLTIYLRL